MSAWGTWVSAWGTWVSEWGSGTWVSEWGFKLGEAQNDEIELVDEGLRVWTTCD